MLYLNISIDTTFKYLHTYRYIVIEWFTKFFKYGVPSHGGFAIGIERMTQALLSLSNIREAVLFPRDTIRLTP